MFKSRLRIVVAMILLIISLAALAWGFLPGARIIRRQKIQPTEMMLPTPASFVPAGRSLAELDHLMAGLEQHNKAICAIHGIERFQL